MTKKRSNFFALIRFVFIVFLVDIGYAQIVKVEPQQVGDSSRWKGNLDVNLNITRNTTSIFLFNTGTQLTYSLRKSRIMSLNDLRILLNDGSNLENRGFQHLRYQKDIDSLITWEAFTQVQFDEVLRIGLRALFGSGPRFNFVEQKNAKIYLGTLYMYEYEEEMVTENINRNHRLSSYLMAQFPLNKKGQVNLICYYQPRLDLISDYRINASGNISLKLSKSIRFQVTLEASQDTNPVEGITNLTYSILNGIRVSF